MDHCQQQDDHSRDHLTAMLRQEASFYRCNDYMAHERQPSSHACSKLVEECANLVTDHHHHFSSPKSPSSTTRFEKVESVVSMCDVKEVQQQQQHSHHHHHHAHEDTAQSHQQAKHEDTYTFWRQQMFDWACMVIDSFGMDRQAVAMSFNLLDRYVSYELARHADLPITRDDYQLFSMTCLYIAVKVLEPYPRKISIQTLVDMSKNYYSRQVIEQTERDILQGLSWHVHAPTAIGFAKIYTKLLNQSSFRMESTIETLTEISVADSFFVACRPSTVGLAAVVLAARLEGTPHPQKLLQEVCVPVDQDEFRIVYLQLEKLYSH